MTGWKIDIKSKTQAENDEYDSDYRVAKVQGAKFFSTLIKQKPPKQNKGKNKFKKPANVEKAVADSENAEVKVSADNPNVEKIVADSENAEVKISADNPNVENTRADSSVENLKEEV